MTVRNDCSVAWLQQHYIITSEAAQDWHSIEIASYLDEAARCDRLECADARLVFNDAVGLKA